MKPTALISAVIIFAVATAASSDERGQVHLVAETCANAGETAFPIPLSKLLTTSCQESLAEVAAGDLRNLAQVCVRGCVGVVCGSFKRLDNETLVNWCADSVADLCRFLGKPVSCEWPTSMERTCRAAARDAFPLIPDLECRAYIVQLLDGGITDNLEKLCVPNCAGTFCNFFNDLGNQTLIDLCTDTLSRHCSTLRPSPPNVCLISTPECTTCAGSIAVVLPAVLGLAGLFTILIRP